MGSVFRFKQFEVDQRDCAMKINTDGVLLGAVSDFESPNRILDIGSGTGIISLMMAQRFDQAHIDAVEIDELAFLRAKSNFDNSVFSTRLSAYHSSFELIDTHGVYDLIISNPPFYTNSLHNPDAKKTLARHTDLDFFNRLLSFSLERLSSRGSLQIILPTDLAKEVVNLGKLLGLHIRRIISVRSFGESEVIRQIIDFRKNEGMKMQNEDLIIYEAKGVYTSTYKQLLSPFFLAF